LQKGFREESVNGQMDGRTDGRAKPPRDRVEHERGNGTVKKYEAYDGIVFFVHNHIHGMAGVLGPY
jgi:hypothetical protein